MLSKTKWLQLSINLRTKIAQLFNIPKSGYTHVMDSTILSDGYSDQDLVQLTLEKLQIYFKTTETDYYKLFDQLVEQLIKEEQELKVLQEQIFQPVIQSELEQTKPAEQEVKEIKSKRGRPKKTLLL